MSIVYSVVYTLCYWTCAMFVAYSFMISSSENPPWRTPIHMHCLWTSRYDQHSTEEAHEAHA